MTDIATSLVITDVTVLVHDATGSVGFDPDQTIVITDGTFSSISPSGAPLPSGAEIIDGAGMVAMPGLINCHTHSPMVMFRGVAEDVPDHRWFNDFLWPMEVNMTVEDVELGARLAAAEMIRGGVTTFADQYFHMDTIAAVVDEVGLRANLGQTYFSTDGPAGLEAAVDFATRWKGAAGGRITTALGPHANYTVNDDDLEKTAAAALENDLVVHIHASESLLQTKHSRERLGYTPIEALRRTGILETKLLIAHGVGIVPEDLPLLAPHASHIGVGSAPKGYLKLATDTTPIRALDAIGVAVGIATDGAAWTSTLDVWENMTLMSLTQKSTERDATWMTSADVLRHATTQSARAVDLATSVGRIAPGFRADLILVDLSSPRLQPVHHLANTLVLSACSSDVDTTIVEGKVLMRGRKLLTVDVAAVVAELTPRLARLTDTTHGTRLQEYTA